MVLLTANLLVAIVPSKNFLTHQWQDPSVEYSVQNARKAYLEPSHTSKMELLRKKLTVLSVFAKKLGLNIPPSAKVCENATFK